MDFSKITELEINKKQVIELCCNGNIVWSADNGNIILVANNGNSHSFSYQQLPIKDGDFRYTDGQIVLKPFSSNKDLSSYSNLNFYSLQKISISNSRLTAIAENGCKYCTNLDSIEIPKIKTLKRNSFYGCNNESLSVFNIQNVENIEPYALGNCNNLIAVEVPSTNLSFIAYSDGSFLVNKNKKMLMWSSIPSTNAVTIPNTVSCIAEGSFLNCNDLTYVDARYVLQIQSKTFDGCTLLQQITFGNSTLEKIPTVCIDSVDNCTYPIVCVVPDNNYNAWITSDVWKDLIASNKIKVITYSSLDGNFIGTCEAVYIGSETKDIACVYNASTNNWKCSFKCKTYVRKGIFGQIDVTLSKNGSRYNYHISSSGRSDSWSGAVSINSSGKLDEIKVTHDLMFGTLIFNLTLTK